MRNWILAAVAGGILLANASAYGQDEHEGGSPTDPVVGSRVVSEAGGKWHIVWIHVPKGNTKDEDVGPADGPIIGSKIITNSDGTWRTVYFHGPSAQDKPSALCGPASGPSAGSSQPGKPKGQSVHEIQNASKDRARGELDRIFDAFSMASLKKFGFPVMSDDFDKAKIAIDNATVLSDEEFKARYGSDPKSANKDAATTDGNIYVRDGLFTRSDITPESVGNLLAHEGCHSAIQNAIMNQTKPTKASKQDVQEAFVDLFEPD